MSTASAMSFFSSASAILLLNVILWREPRGRDYDMAGLMFVWATLEFFVGALTMVAP